jgi:2-keto-3-deoxy-6-phosphogluconate aldolase
MDIKQKLLDGGVIAVIRHANKNNIIPVVQALRVGGSSALKSPSKTTAVLRRFLPVGMLLMILLWEPVPY